MQLTFLRMIVRNRRTEIAIFLFAVSVQLFAAAFMIWHEGRIGHYSASGVHFPVFEGDSRRYMSLALNTIQYGKFSVSPEYYVPVDSATRAGQFLPESYLTIGYPLFLMAALLLFHSFLAITFLQILLSGVGVVLVYKLARFVLPKNWSAVPAVLFAIDPTFVLQSVIIRNDAFAAVFLLASVYVFLRANDEQRLSGSLPMLISGLLLGYAALTRPIYQWALGLFLLYIFASAVKNAREKYRELLRPVLALSAGVFLVVFPWMLRNQLSFQSWSLSSASEWTVMINAGQFLEAEGNLRPGAVLGPWLERAGTPGFLPLDVKKEVWPVVFGRPLAYAKFHIFKSVTAFFFNDGLREIVFSLRLPLVRGFDDNLGNLLYNRELRALWGAVNKHRASAVLLFSGALFWGSVTLLVLAGIVGTLAQKQKRLTALFFAAIVGYLAFFTGAAFTPRQRIPATPFLFILATVGIYCMIRAIRTYGRSPTTH